MIDVEQLRVSLKEFHTLASAVWTTYQDVGPGRVDAALFDGGEQLASQIGGLLADEAAATDLPAEVDGEELRTAVLKVADLATRCATRSEGLCFITGEAGLVPRRDWHAEMDEGLAAIDQAVTALGRK
jgi:hypothetical protein